MHKSKIKQQTSYLFCFLLSHSVTYLKHLFANDVYDSKICQNNENYYNNMRKWLLSLPAEYQGCEEITKYTLQFEMESFRCSFLIFGTFSDIIRISSSSFFFEFLRNLPENALSIFQMTFF